MKLYTTEQSYDLGPCAVALGTFDGLHAGHQALIRRMVAEARRRGLTAAVFTFDRHPLAALKPEAAPAPLLTPEERREKFERLGVEALIERPFTREFARLTPEEFAGLLAESLSPRVCVAGYNYTFGRMGSGNVSALTRLGAALGFEVIEVPAVMMDGEPVSSTRIRALMAAGETEKARRLMEESE